MAQLIFPREATMKIIKYFLDDLPQGWAIVICAWVAIAIVCGALLGIVKLSQLI